MKIFHNMKIIDVEDGDFGAMVICAERYALGRRSYMPSIIACEIRQLMPILSDRDIRVLIEDIEHPIGDDYGDELIDKPYWLSLLEDLKAEQTRRLPNGGRECANCKWYDKPHCNAPDDYEGLRVNDCTQWAEKEREDNDYTRN